MGFQQLILAKLPKIDPLTLNQETVEYLGKILKIDHSLDLMRPQDSEGQRLLAWLLS